MITSPQAKLKREGPMKKWYVLYTLILFVNGCGLEKKQTQKIPLNAISTKNKVIVGEVDWIPINSLSSNDPVFQNGKGVGMITVPLQNSKCTAFFITKDLVMSNWHCFPGAEDAKGAKLYLDFLTGTSFGSYSATPFLRCDQWMMADEELDFSILKCQRQGTDFKNLTLDATANRSNINFDEKVYLIHQNCDYYARLDCPPIKIVSWGSLKKGLETIPEPEFSRDFFYSADTLTGSSGGPVFSAKTHKVIAIHGQGHGLSFEGQERGTLNSGVPMGHILKKIKTQFPNLEWPSL